MKRIALFLATNLAIIVVLSITLRIFGVERILDEQGVNLDINNLLVFSAVFGFGGSLISLGSRAITASVGWLRRWLVRRSWRVLACRR